MEHLVYGFLLQFGIVHNFSFNFMSFTFIMITMCKSKLSQLSTMKITELDAKLNVGNNVKKVDWRQVSILSVLGQGSFSILLEVDVGSTSQDFHLDHEIGTQKEELQSHYALKYLNSNKVRNKDSFILGVSDLVTEADILSNLNHPHIIQLRGVSSLPPSESYLKNHDVGYFLLLDVLDDTLDKRLNLWSTEKQSNSQLLIGMGRKKKRRMMYERIENVAIGISDAMAYLHEQRIVFRDLKPANVGFDCQGTVKLFDFGLARPVDEYGNSLEDDIAGTYRYMAPENIMGSCSGLPSDVYSFGILLWEICTLTIPFGGINSLTSLVETVVEKKHRPQVGSVLCSKVKRIIQDCWASCPDIRPPFNQIHSSLMKICSTDADKPREKDEETFVLSMTSRSFRRSLGETKSKKSSIKLHSMMRRCNTSITEASFTVEE